MSFHTGQTFTYGETPSATKWNYLWENDYALADGTGIEDSAITPEKLLTGAGTSWPFQSWSPSWTNLSIGAGTIKAYYCQVGKLIFYRLFVAIAADTSISGPTIFSPPLSANADYGSRSRPSGSVIGYDSGTAEYIGIATFDSSDVDEITIRWNDGSGASTTTFPWSEANGDTLNISGFYEAA